MRRVGVRWAGLVLLLGGCLPVTPRLPEAAAVSAPASWRDVPTSTDRIDPRWWRAFDDPDLTDLVETALVRNADVLRAAAAVEASRAQVRLARSAERPMLDGVVDGARSRQRSPATGQAIEQWTAQPNLQATWEVDLFGRLRSLTRSARLQYRASQADRDSMALSVASQVCEAYFDLTAQDLQLAVTKDTLKSRDVDVVLREDQERHGYISQFEVTQARSEQESVAQQVPIYEQGIRADENAISLLTGQLPQEVRRKKDFRDFKPPPIPATLPSDLLRRRPDIASAEYDLAAADATIAARRADFLPRLNLMGMVGLDYASAPQLPTLNVWSLGGSVMAPIYEGGQLRANFELAIAQRDEQAFAYKTAVLTAFRDVETDLSAALSYQAQIKIAYERRATLKQSIAYAVDRYREGYSTYLDQLDTQRNFYSSQISAITLRRDQLTNLARLFVALGGGWSDEHVSSSVDHPPPSRAVQPYASSGRN